MEYIYYLEGLGCANCAAKMEDAISRHKAVKSANVVFMKKKLIVEPKGSMTGQLLQEITDIVTGIENHVKVLPFTEGGSFVQTKETAHNHEHGDDCHCSGEHDHGEEEKLSHKQENHGHTHEKMGFVKINAVCMAVGIAAFAVALLLDKLDLTAGAVSALFYIAAYMLVAYDVLWQSAKHICKGQVFDEFFLMSVATLGALLIGEYPEAVAVMLFYKVGEYFQDKAVDQARGSIEALVNIKPDFANIIKKDGTVERKNPSEAVVGDIIEVRAGERVPLDGKLIEGTTSLDMAALTGETKPVDISPGDDILSGSVNMTGYIKVRVSKTFGDSTVSRIMDMVENAADKKSHAEQFITRFAKIYTPIVCFLALALAVVPPIAAAGEWSVWIYRALSFLVVSCPCALVISVPLGFFGGIGVASKNGILVKGGNYLEALAGISVIAFDKTGTLTKGSFHVSRIHPHQAGLERTKEYLKRKQADEIPKESKEMGIFEMGTEELLLYLLSIAEERSNHPIGKSILKACGKDIAPEDIDSFEEIAGYGLVVNSVYGRILAGNEKMMKKYHISYEREDNPATIIYGALEDIFIGSVVISDEIKEDSREGIEKLAREGITHTVLLSGDSNALVSEVAEEIGIETAFGELLPGDKLEKIEQMYRQNAGAKIAYVGDGINDAPVLARVDVGIAMGGVGQDAAIEAADIVLMTDEIGKLAQAVSISKFTRQIVMENILLALGIKVLVLILIAAGLSSMWMAVFADVGVALLAVCNSIRVYRHNFSK